MRIIDRYLLRGFVNALLYCLTLFFILFVVIDVFNNLDEFLKHGVSMRIILSYYLYSLPSIFVQVVPIAVLVAILYMLGNLNRHNEILALKASGISSFHILTPYLFMGVLISFGVFLMSEKVVPRTAVTSTSIMEGLILKGRKKFEERSIKNVTLFAKGNRMVFAREFEISTGTLYDVVLFEDDPHRIVQNKITAKKAVFEDDAWMFYDVIRYQMNRRGELAAEPVFSESLRLGLDAKPDDFLKESSQVEFMNTRQLDEYMGHLQGASKKLARRLLVDFHYKIAFPFVSFVVVLLGAPLAMRSARGGAVRGIGVSVAIVLLYFGINSVCLAMGKGGSLPPAFSAWFSNLFFSAVGIYLIKTTS